MKPRSLLRASARSLLFLVLGCLMALGILRLRNAREVVGQQPVAIIVAKSSLPGDLSLRDGDGLVVLLKELVRDKPVVMYVLSAACSWCKRNVASVRALAACVAGRYDFVSVALNRDGDTSSVLPAGLPMFLDSSEGVVVAGTPTTALVGPDLTVWKVWEGAFGGSVKREIEVTLECSLPDLPLG